MCNFAGMKSPNFLKNYTIAQLRDYVRSMGEQAFRADQIFDAMYAQAIDSIYDIATLPKTVRERLQQETVFSAVRLEKIQESNDGTKKFLFELFDGRAIETVLIPSEMVTDDGSPKRMTLCVSTQVGCPLNCQFCATASLKLKRNLFVAEIVDQLLTAQRYTEKKITNLVFMGMGEPMLNYDNVMAAVSIFTHGEAPLLGSKRITLSTAGVVPGIIRMADEKSPIKLAISLHATTNGLRKEIMPIARKYELTELGNAIEYYYRKTRRPVTYEYILFEGINDSEADAKRLARFTRRVPSKVNVIPFHDIEFTNPTGIAAALKPTSREKFRGFISLLQSHDVTVMIRSSSGVDIDAACGQLAFSNASTQTTTPLLSEVQ